MKNSDFKDIIVNNSEVVLDYILKDGLLKDIPIINNLVSLYNIKTTISDKIFYRKVVSFYETFYNVNRAHFVRWNSWALENTESAEKLQALLSYTLTLSMSLLNVRLLVTYSGV